MLTFELGRKIPPRIRSKRTSTSEIKYNCVGVQSCWGHILELELEWGWRREKHRRRRSRRRRTVTTGACLPYGGWWSAPHYLWFVYICSLTYVGLWTWERDSGQNDDVRTSFGWHSSFCWPWPLDSCVLLIPCEQTATGLWPRRRRRTAQTNTIRHGLQKQEGHAEQVILLRCLCVVFVCSVYAISSYPVYEHFYTNRASE